MRLRTVSDVGVDDVRSRTYDLAVFASGYEERACFIPSLVSPDSMRNALVIGFTQFRDARQRTTNDAFFAKTWNAPVIAAGSDDLAIAGLAQRLSAQPGSAGLQLLVDYSSMSRLWYAGLLNWARCQERFASVQIDFAYAVGSYPRGVSPGIVRDILPVVGFEGGPAPLRPSVALLGLGFDGFAPLTVIDTLEPNIAHAFLAVPDDRLDYFDLAAQLNREVIESHTETKRAWRLPLTSVERCYVLLSEFLAAYRDEADVSLVPMGPKTHVLASMLVAARFPEVSCLRVIKDEAPEMVGTTGEVAVTRVEFVSGTMAEA